MPEAGPENRVVFQASQSSWDFILHNKEGSRSRTLDRGVKRVDVHSEQVVRAAGSSGKSLGREQCEGVGDA